MTNDISNTSDSVTRWRINIREWSGGISSVVMLAGLGLFLVLTPYLRMRGIGIYDLKRLLQVGLLAVLAIGPMFSPRGRVEWLKTLTGLPAWARAAISAFFGLGVLSAVSSVDPLHSMLEVVHFALLSICIVSLTMLYRLRPNDVRKILLAIVFVAVLVYIVAFFRDYLLSQLGLSYSFRHHPNALWPWGEFLGFEHWRFFNQFQTWTLPLILVPFVVGQRDTLTKSVCFAVPALWWMLLFASGGRGTVVSVTAAAVLVWTATRGSRRLVLSLALSALIGGLLYWLLFQVLGDTAASLAERDLTSSMGRFRFWRHGLELFLTRPMLGIGPGQYAWFHDPYAASPHSAVVQILAEWGIVALLIFVGLALVAVVAVFGAVRKRGSNDMVLLALATSLFAGMAHSFLSGLIVTPVSQVMMVVVASMVWGTTTEWQSERKSDRTSTSAFLVAATLMLVLVEISLTAVSYRRMDARRSEIENAAHRNQPRFWWYGCPRSHPAEYPLLPRNEVERTGE